MQQQYISFEIISQSKHETINVLWVEIESPTGSFIVGPNHSPLISIVKKKGILTYKTDDLEEVTQEVCSGIFEVEDNKAVLILN